MKRYTEFTKEELAIASDEEVQVLKDIEVMVAGITPAPPPKTVCEKDVDLERTVKMWEVDNILFETESDAVSFLKLKRFKEDYNYDIGYNFKFPSKSLVADTTVKLLYSERAILDSSAILKKAKEVKDIYDKEKQAYTNYLTEKSKIENKVYAAVADAKDFAYDVKQAKNVLDKNLSLSGDIEIAKKFFAEQYKDRQDILNAVLV